MININNKLKLKLSLLILNLTDKEKNPFSTTPKNDHLLMFSFYLVRFLILNITPIYFVVLISKPSFDTERNHLYLNYIITKIPNNVTLHAIKKNFLN